VGRRLLRRFVAVALSPEPGSGADDAGTRGRVGTAPP